MAMNLKEKLVMEVSAPSACNRIFSFVVPADATTVEWNKVVNYFSQMAQLPGFRAGKAPRNLVAKKYADSINDEMRNQIIHEALQKIYDDKELNLLSINVKDMAELKVGEDFKFSFTASIVPEMDLGDYKNIKVDIPLDAVEESAVDASLESYCKLYGRYADITTAAEASDMLKVDYKSDLVLAEDASASLKRQASAEDAFIWLNEPEIIPGCIAALTGAEIGKEYNFTANYPADYREADLANKSVNYTVTVKGIQRKTPLTMEELEKNFAKSQDEIRNMIRENLENEAKNKQRQSVSEKILEILNERAGEFELPQDLLEREINKRLKMIAREKVATEADADKFKAEIEEHRKAVLSDASVACRNEIILRKIAHLENININEDELNFQIDIMSKQYGYAPKDMRKLMEQSGSLDDFRLDILNGKVLSMVTDRALNK